MKFECCQQWFRRNLFHVPDFVPKSLLLRFSGLNSIESEIDLILVKQVAQPCPENIFPYKFWSIADLYPDVVSHLHVQIRLIGNFALNGCVPWLTNTDDELCPFLQIQC